MRLRFLLLTCFSFACLQSIVSAQDDSLTTPPQNLENNQSTELLEQLISASSDGSETIIDKIVAQTGSSKEIAALITDVKPATNEERAKKLTTGWVEWMATDEAGTERPYQMYLPQGVVDGKAPQAVIVHMHGAVNRPEFSRGLGSPQAVGYGAMLWKSVADNEDFVIVCPQGRTECAWWTDNGVSHVQAVIRDVRRSITVPDRSIFGAGFSDGASGCYYMAMVAPGPFAGFIAMNGHPAVASGASDKQVYLRNMSATPIFAGMTQEDSLYPSRNVLPHLTKAISNGANIHIVSYPKVNHQPLYFKDQTNAIVSFIKNTKRENTDELRWLTAESKTGLAKWLELLELGEGENDAESLPDVNIDSTPGRIRLGIEIRDDNDGPRIHKVTNDSTAEQIGIETNDVIVTFDDNDIKSQTDLIDSIRRLKRGDTFGVSVKRKGEVVDLEGKIPEFKPQPVYRRSEGPTSFANVRLNDDASIAVTSCRVKKMRIWLPNDWSDKEEIILKLNDVEKSVKVQTLSAKELLTRFARTGDRFDNRFAFVVVEN